MNKNIKKRIIAFLIALSCITEMSGCKEISENDRLREFSGEKSKVESIVIPVETSGSKDASGSNRSKTIPKEKLKVDGIIMPNVEEKSNSEKGFGYTDKDIEEFIEISQQQFQCPNETFNLDSLYKKIINNSGNVNFCNNMFFCSSTASIEEKEEIKMFRRALRNALNICFENATNDIYEDYCKMSQISIVRTDYGQAASFHYNENRITVNTELIKLDIESSKNQADYEEYVKQCLTHELNHVRQFLCPHSGYTAFSTKDYGFMTCIESSAESQKYNVASITPDNVNLAYSTLRNGENLLFLIPLSYPNKNMNDYYNSLFNSDLAGLYKFFELSTKDEYRTFYNILYDLNSLDHRTDYSKMYSQQELITRVGPRCKLAIFKMALSNLLKNIKEYSITVDDAVTIYIIIKSQLVFSQLFSSETTDKYEKDLVDGINSCDEDFKSSIVETYQITQSDYDNILEYVVTERYSNILNDPILEQFPMIGKILRVNAIEQENMIGITIGDTLSDFVKIKY